MKAPGLTIPHIPFSMRVVTTVSVSAGAAALGAAGLQVFPNVVGTVFIGGAARLAGLVSGAAAVPMEAGWALVIAGQPVLVTEACSATDFYLLTTVVLGWHFASRLRWPLALAGAVAAALPVTMFVNALRIVAVAQAHRWVIPRMPEAYEAFLHMLTGAAVFLPALIGLNLIFEYHGRARNSSSVA